MNWFKAIALLCASVAFSLHAKANNNESVEPFTNKKDTLKVEQRIEFNPLMLFSLPKAVDPLEQKGSTTKDEQDEIGAI